MKISAPHVYNMMRPDADLSDLTTSVEISPRVVEFNSTTGEVAMLISFDIEPDSDEQLRILRRLTTANNVEEALVALGEKAVQDNINWRNNVFPQLVSGADSIIESTSSTALEKQLAQGIKSLASQTRDLCRQNEILARLVLRKLDTIE